MLNTKQFIIIDRFVKN